MSLLLVVVTAMVVMIIATMTTVVVAVRLTFYKIKLSTLSHHTVGIIIHHPTIVS